MALEITGTNRRVSGALVYLVTGLVILFATSVHSNGKLKMKTIPPHFETIQLGASGETACSPNLGGWDYCGIELNAPSKVIVTEEYIFPLCGGWTFSYKFINKFKNIYTEIVLVVTDLNSFKSYSGGLRKPGLEYEPNRKAIGTDQELEENTVSHWFNVDL